MKKTLKLLMAIVLFAVVLMIATSVNAATITYDNLEKALEEEADKVADDPNYKPLIENKDGYYVIDGTDTLKITETIKANNMKIVLNANLKASMVVTGTTTVKTTKTLGTVTGTVQVEKGATLVTPKEIGTMLNKGTIYVSDKAAILADTTNDGGIIYSVAALTLADNTAVTLKEGFKVDGVEYTEVLAETEGLDKRMTYTVTKIVPKGEVAEATAIEAGKEYSLTLKAEFDGKELTDEVILADPMGLDAKKNCDFTANDITVLPKKDLDGDTIALAAQLKNVDESKKDLAVIKIGEIKNDEPTAEPTAEPTTEPTATPDADKDNLEKDETPKTGDHIIPATAVLAVVVVANVVYFARSKKS